LQQVESEPIRDLLDGRGFWEPDFYLDFDRISLLHHIVLEKLKGCSAQVTDSNAYPPENGEASVVILFSDGTKLRADYWRVIKDGRASISSVDHKQQYGLPAPIDAVEALTKDLQGQLITDAQHDKETGDLLLWFTNNIKCQILNLTGYEIWEINFPDGTGEYSNYAK
jgi:hypothetical protein